MIQYDMVVMGAPGVGKSALILQLTENRFVPNWDPTFEDCFRKQITLDEEICLLNICDTVEPQEESFMPEGWLMSGKGFLFSFAIDSRSSFQQVRFYRNKILQIFKTQQVPILLVGTKCDLEEFRQVPITEAENLAHSFGCSYYETSAKESVHVEDVFYHLIREMRAHPIQYPAEQRSNTHRSRCVLQ